MSLKFVPSDTWPLAGKKGKKESDKHKDKKDKKGIRKDKHRDKKKDKNLVIDLTDKEDEQLIKKAMARSLEYNEELVKAARREKKMWKEMERELKAAKKKKKNEAQMDVINLTEDDEPTTASSSTTGKRTQKSSKYNRGGAPPDLKQVTGMNRVNLINRLNRVEDEMHFMNTEALLYKQYQVEGADALLKVTLQNLETLGQVRQFIEQHVSMDTLELDTNKELVQKAEEALSTLTQQFVSKNFGNFTQRVLDWRQYTKVVTLTEKENEALEKITDRMGELMDERSQAWRRIHDRAAGLVMVVEGQVNGSDVADYRALRDIFGAIKHLLNVANDVKKESLLELYNETRVAEEALVALELLMAEKYGAQQMPQAVSEKLDQMREHLGKVLQGWEKRQQLFITYKDPDKKPKDEALAPVLAHLPLLAVLIEEVQSMAELVDVVVHAIIPDRVSYTPLKLSVLFDTENERQPYTLETMDQHRNILHEGPIDCFHIKSQCLAVNKGLYLAPSQFKNPHSVNGVYAAQDISKYQIITFVEGQVKSDYNLPDSEDPSFLLMFQIFRGLASVGLMNWYLVANRDERGLLYSSDMEEVVLINPSVQVVGAGGLMHDCLNLEKYRRLMGDVVTQSMISGGGGKKKGYTGGGGGGDDEEGDEVGEEERSMDEQTSGEEGVDSDIVTGGGLGDDVRPNAKDFEAVVAAQGKNNNAERPCINAVVQIYDDPYNQLIRETAMKHGPEFLVLLDPKHTVVVVEALRTIRRGEEILVKFDEKVWSNYAGGRGHTPQPLDTKEPLSQYSLDDPDLRPYLSALKQSTQRELARQKSLVYPLVPANALPLYEEGFLDRYQKPTVNDEESSEDDDEGEDEESDSGVEIVVEDDESDPEMYYKPRKMGEKLDTLADRLAAGDVRRADIAFVKSLMKRVAEEAMDDDVYMALVNEIIVRVARLVDQNEVQFYVMETNLYKQSIDNFKGELDETRESYRRYLELQGLRKKIELLVISDAVNDTDESRGAIEQLEKQRDAMMLVLRPEMQKRAGGKK